MWKVRLFGRQHAAAEAEIPVRLDLIVPRQKCRTRAAVAALRLVGAALGDPVMEFVAVEEIIGAERDRGRGVVFERKQRGAVAGRTAGRIERTHVRAHTAHLAAQQPHDLDLVRDLVERDTVPSLTPPCNVTRGYIAEDGRARPAWLVVSLCQACYTRKAKTLGPSEGSFPDQVVQPSPSPHAIYRTINRLSGQAGCFGGNGPR